MITIKMPQTPNFDIFEELEKDSKVDKTNLDDEITKIPYIHGKWLKVFIYLQKQLREATREYEKKRIKLVEYYLGHASDEVYVERPLNRRLLKSEVEDYLKIDEELVNLKENAEIISSTLLTVEKFITELNWRGSNLGKAIEFLRWKNGG